MRHDKAPGLRSASTPLGSVYLFLYSAQVECHSDRLLSHSDESRNYKQLPQ